MVEMPPDGLLQTVAVKEQFLPSMTHGFHNKRMGQCYLIVTSRRSVRDLVVVHVHHSRGDQYDFLPMNTPECIDGCDPKVRESSVGSESNIGVQCGEFLPSNGIAEEIRLD